MFETKIEQASGGWRVFTTEGSSWWGVGPTFPSEDAAQLVADQIEYSVAGRVRPMRYAIVTADAGRGEQIRAYLPDNYRLVGRTPIGGSNRVRFLIAGRDLMGWTLDDYVLPRLASGMYYGEEVA